MAVASTLPDLTRLTAAERAEGRRALEREIEWREAAASLTLGEPDPAIARRHLLEFIRVGHPNYLVGWFHRELCYELERFSREITAGLSPRLLIAAPPRSGKSEIVSRRWPVWHLGRNPRHEVVVASYGQDLANDMSRDARAIRNEVVDWWPHLAPGNRDGVENWRTVGGGSYFAVGVGGPLTGRGCNCLILDDPLKNFEEASSQVIRDSRWHWYTSTAYTRLAPGGGVLAMATRWHEDDPSGRMLEQLRTGEEAWRVVSYPAIAEQDEPYRREGEALHPERYPLEQLHQIRTVLGSRSFAALYQQRPTPAAGGTFQRAWLAKRFAHDPQRPPRPYDEIIVSIDATFTDSATSDFVSIQAWGRYGWTEYHALDEVHARMSYVDTRQSLRDFVRKWNPSAVLIEAAANGHALISDLQSEIPGIIGFKPIEYGNKDIRAQLATPLFESGCVSFPELPWVGDTVEELVSYPAGTNDDRVDALSQTFIYWSRRRSNTHDTEAMIQALQGVMDALGE